MINQIDKVLHTAYTHTTSGRDGTGRSSDGALGSQRFARDCEMSSDIITYSPIGTTIGPFRAKVRPTASALYPGEPQMKHSSTHRSRTIAALAGLLLVTSLTSARAAALDDETRAIAGSPLAVSIEGPAGERRRLVHVPHRGWQLIEGRGGAVRREAALIHPTIAPDQAAPDADVHSPLTVLIDGPTGSAFVWRQDEGWRFVGRVAAGEQ